LVGNSGAAQVAAFGNPSTQIAKLVRKKARFISRIPQGLFGGFAIEVAPAATKIL
jgi:hypothetical protein